ncbi:hypothetical protein NQ317_019358 [Molorchus minor]|uniref:NFX1-type zinc finger-containing protein 1 n=1 Tax=Molorchus minor TaxID=1323400 RepID=A0ABQ9J925_9CUCU|nr:hypothetical protein NQ317_019358 [Molorchus minor]
MFPFSPVGKEYKMLSTINAHIASTIKLLDDKRRKDIHLGRADLMRKPIYKTFERLSSENTLHLMKQMKVIGVTTTRAASMYSDLEELKCPIVIIEEAAEVLESHNISVLTPHCQQLLLIGDHQQLKPMTSDYNMQKTYDLGISLFERMVNNDMRCYTLNVQHRMRPELCSLITPTIYPILINHASTKQYPSISGIGKDLYFVDHDHAEEDAEEASKKNKFEVEFLIQLAIYLLNNNYQPEEITILATYLGQVKALLRERQNIPNELLKKINITSVDNFQGEENKIILLSLVRNNQQSKIGFLAMENRVCVALSRAKEGLYIIGNMRQLSAKSKVWKSIKASLETQNAIGKHLPLTCKLHNKTTLLIHPSQFKRVKTGNCELPCNVSLKCGHMCTRRCHRLGTHDSSQCSVLSRMPHGILTELLLETVRSSGIIADYEYSNPSRYQPTPLQPANNWSCINSL